MTTTEEKLAADFPQATRQDWLKLVDKAIKGGDFEKRLVSRTADGLRIEPIYTRAEEVPGTPQSVPGSAPLTRGTDAAVRGLGWQIHQLNAEADPSTANAQILEELEGGVHGIVLQVESPGQFGIRIKDANDFATVLTGMYLDLAPVQLKIGLGAPKLARDFLAALPLAGAKPGQAQAFLNLDCIGKYARFGGLARSLDDATSEVMAVAAQARKAEPHIRTVRVDATVYHEAGATEAQELAAMAATLVAYLKRFELAGVAPTDALAQISLALSADTDQFLTMAKLRAARQIVWRIADACGAGAAAAKTHITAITSERMMAKRDPWTNLLRLSVACTGAALGGAQAITVLPYTWPLGKTDKFARRIARNIQMVLQEESSLGRVLDPAGGSWYMENLTRDLAQKAWALFQSIEAKGGMVAALRAGFVQDEIAAVAATRAKAIATGRSPLTGVSAFPMLGDDGVNVSPHPAAPAVNGKPEIKPLAPHRLAEPFEALRDAADAAGHKPEVFLASLGAVIDHTLRSTWIKNYLAAGGIAALTSDGYASAEDAAAAFKASGAKAACICSSDALYEQHAEATAKALKAAGARLVLMAGKPGEREATLRTAGVDDFLAAGNDAVAVLKALQETLGASR
jgi:methylmalonyl-CoA mutase